MCLVGQLCPTFASPWTVAHQAALSMEVFRQEYCSWLPFPTPGIERSFLVSPALVSEYFTTEPHGKPPTKY